MLFKKEELILPSKKEERNKIGITQDSRRSLRIIKNKKELQLKLLIIKQSIKLRYAKRTILGEVKEIRLKILTN